MSVIWLDVDVALAEVPVNVVPLTDDGDFKTIEEAVPFNADGMELIWHFTTPAGATSSIVVTPTSGGNYPWVHQDGGIYTCGMPASGGASANNDTEGFGYFTGKATGVMPWRSPTFGLRAADLNDKLIESAWSATLGLAGTALSDIQTQVGTAGAGLTALPAVDVKTDGLTAASVSTAAVTKIQTGLATPTNITAGTITTVTNLTNAPTVGDLTATMKASVTAAATAATPTAAAVTGSVGSVAAGGITSASFDTDAVSAAAVSPGAVTKIQTGLATPTNITAGTITTVTNLTNAPTNGDLTAAMKSSVTTAATAATPTIAAVSGAVGSVTGSVGSVAAGGITAASFGTDAVSAVAVSAAAVTKIQAGLATPTNITAGTITTVTNLTNAPTVGDLTATMKASVTAAATAATPTIASVSGAVGSVTGSVGSVATGGITAASIADNAIDADALAAGAVTKIQTGLATPTNITAGTITTVTNLTNAPTNGDLTATMKTSITTAATAATPTVAAVTGNVGGSVGSIATDGLTAGAVSAAAVTKIQAGLPTTLDISAAILSDGTPLDGADLNTLAGHDPGGTIAAASDLTLAYEVKGGAVYTATSGLIVSCALYLNGTIADATSCTVTVYRSDGLSVVSTWDLGPVENSTTHVWYAVSDDVSSTVLADEVYYVRVSFNGSIHNDFFLEAKA